MPLSTKDLQLIRQLVRTEVDLSLDANLEKKLTEKLSHLPSKDELFERLDKIVGELQTMREEQTTMGYRQSDHEDRLHKLEELHPGGRHVSAHP